MVSLDTNDVGYDRERLAFPSLKTCMAIVYQVEGGLFGWHDAYANANVFEQRCARFNDFVQNLSINHAAFGKNLFTLINNNERFFDTKEGNQDWKGQIVLVAKHLGFKGPIWGIRLTRNIAPSVATMDSAYAEFESFKDHHNKKRPIVIRYKTWSDMKFGAVQQVGLPKQIYGHFDTMKQPVNQVQINAPTNTTHIAQRKDDNKPFFMISDTDFIRIR